MKLVNPFGSGRRSISRSPDFQRIANLATRGSFDAAELTREMTEALKTPNGTMKLRPVQAQALYELMVYGGLVGAMGVGTGKTLVFLLASVVLNLKRAKGLLPASLIDKTERERRELAQHWRVDRGMGFISYEALGRVNAATLLDTARPDGLITDESHRLKNPKAACTRRVSRYLKEHPDTKFVSMSGTLLGKSLRDMAHLVRWSLGADASPIPKTEGELEEWADALDERVNPLQRVRPGVLLELAAKKISDDCGACCGYGVAGPGPCDECGGTGKATGSKGELSRARRAFHERLVSTPGIVCSLHAEQVNCSLYVRGATYDVNAATEKNFETLRTLWETPDGWALSEAVDVWRHARELALGFHYVWDPRPPDEWLMARRAWAKFVRDFLSKSRTLDSEKQVALACAKGEIDNVEYTAWLAVKDTFTINQKAVWHDESALEICQRWLEREKGICWVDHTFFGRELSRRTTLPYFGQNGLDSKGNSILDAKGPIIASVSANGTGKNLQAWSKNLITCCPTGASVWEQLLGRTHRTGQLADQVECDVLIGCIEHVDAWKRAEAEAQMASEMLGQPQKILVSDVSMPEVDHLPGARWRKTNKG